METSTIYFYDTPSERVRKEDTYLNNYDITPFTSEIGQSYQSVEHYYQSEKYRDYPSKDEGEAIRLEIINASDAAQSKEIARKYEDEDRANGRNMEHWELWSKRKVDVMRDAIRYKFEQNQEIRKRLKETGDAKLVEDSPVDMFWGGWLPGSLNKLGEVLMEYRSTIQ